MKFLKKFVKTEFFQKYKFSLFTFASCDWRSSGLGTRSMFSKDIIRKSCSHQSSQHRDGNMWKNLVSYLGAQGSFCNSGLNSSLLVGTYCRQLTNANCAGLFTFVTISWSQKAFSFKLSLYEYDIYLRRTHDVLCSLMYLSPAKIFFL